MSTKLKNRRATEQQLGTFIQNMTVSEHMVMEIMDSEVRAGRNEGVRKGRTFSGGGELQELQVAEGVSWWLRHKCHDGAMTQVKKGAKTGVSTSEYYVCVGGGGQGARWW